MISSSQVNNKIDEYDFSALDELAPKQISLNEALKETAFYLLPIAGLLFFIFVLFNGVIPSINEMNTKLDDIEALREEDEALALRIQNILNLEKNIENTQTIIDKINYLVPTGQTEVVAFGERIIQNIQTNTLTYDALKTGELELVTSAAYLDPEVIDQLKEDPTYLPLNQIPTEFGVKGPYEGIRSFFINMYNGPDFFVVNKMELKKTGDNEWSGDISLAKYQFTPNNAFDPVKAYFNISEDTPLNPEVMDFLQKKFVDIIFQENQIETETEN